MADDLKKNLRKLGVTDAEFAKAMADSTAQMKEQEALAKKLTNRFETLTQNLREQGTIASQLNGNTLERKLIAEAIKEAEGDITKISKDDLANIGEKVSKQKKLGTAINQILPGVISFASGVEAKSFGRI